jgi:hypothetical protein
MMLVMLYLLASLDGVLCGLRASAGRCPLIYNWMFNVRSMLRGYLVAQVASVVALIALLLTAFASRDGTPLLMDLNNSAARMVYVFAIYAALVLFNLGLRLLPTVDIRSATSVLALGPLTALRPAVMIAGTMYGVWRSELLATKLLGIFVLALMLAIEWVLNRMNDRIQQREIDSLVPHAPIPN